MGGQSTPPWGYRESDLLRLYILKVAGLQASALIFLESITNTRRRLQLPTSTKVWLDGQVIGFLLSKGRTLIKGQGSWELPLVKQNPSDLMKPLLAPQDPQDQSDQLPMLWLFYEARLITHAQALAHVLARAKDPSLRALGKSLLRMPAGKAVLLALALTYLLQGVFLAICVLTIPLDEKEAIPFPLPPRGGDPPPKPVVAFITLTTISPTAGPNAA